MKPALILSVLGAVFLVGCAAPASKTPAPSTAVTAHSRPGKCGQRLMVRTTAYTHTEPGGIKNAVGGRLRYAKVESSAASDWSWMPIGTKFRMLCNGRTFVIEDYGSALIGRRTVDLYMPSRKLMNQWGCRTVEIEILEWGSSRKSLEVLGARRRHRHVRTMVSQLLAQSKGMPDEMNLIKVN